jgi:putative MATE family efflux protein
MQDLTRGPIASLLLRMAMPIALGMVFQTLYYLIDLYFVAQLGDAAIAGVGAAGNFAFLVMALTQVLAVGTVAPVAQAVGRRDQADANRVFNQSLSLAAVCGAITLIAGYGLAPWYMAHVGAGDSAQQLGVHYFYWATPGFALQFALVAMGSALRGTGIAKPTMVVQLITVVLNAILAPILIAGWGTGHALGVAGAGLATTIAVVVGVILLAVYFQRMEHFVGVDASALKPDLGQWWRILRVGLPAGGEFALMFVYLAIIYFVTRDFGAESQAGFGVGSRVMQAVFLPAMAIAFAVTPVAGQNFGAGLHDRVRETFRVAALMSAVLMAVLTVLCQFAPSGPMRAFTHDPEVVAVGAQFLHIISWNFVASALIFTCSGLFQAMGNTLPSLISSATRLATFAIPALWLARRGGFKLEHLWYLSVATVALQAVVSLLLVRREFARRLSAPALRPEAAVET